jgi:hypothetical protein
MPPGPNPDPDPDPNPNQEEAEAVAVARDEAARQYGYEDAEDEVRLRVEP